MKEALDKVRADLGPEAVILDARQCQARGFAKILNMLGLGRKPLFEVMAAIDNEATVWNPNFSAALEKAKQAGEAMAAAKTLPEPDGVDAALGVIARESAVRARVSSLPEQMIEFYECLVDEDVSEKTAFRLANAVSSEYESAPSERDEFLEWACVGVADMLDVAGPIEIVRGRRKVVALIGPTGVGKTTTIAKIAANIALVEKANVALITGDTYRIAAIEQIKTYAEIIGVPWEVVYSPRDMEAALAKHSDAELILIDTAGRSPNSPTRMYELRSMMDAALPEEVHLVLSSTTRRQDIEHLVDRFAQVGFDKVILTKLDESSILGAMFNIYARSGKPFSYFANGQSVPEDILPATRSGIAEMLFSKLRTGGRL